MTILIDDSSFDHLKKMIISSLYDFFHCDQNKRDVHFFPVIQWIMESIHRFFSIKKNQARIFQQEMCILRSISNSMIQENSLEILFLQKKLVKCLSISLSILAISINVENGHFQNVKSNQKNEIWIFNQIFY